MVSSVTPTQSLQRTAFDRPLIFNGRRRRFTLS